MNTQTHLLVSCALLVVPAAQSVRLSPISTGAITVAALAGALLPDASLFIMWGVAKLQAVPESVIWRDWYYADSWQYAGSVTNSIPAYLLIAVAAWSMGGRLDSLHGAGRSTMKYAAASSGRTSDVRATLALVFATAALLHVVTDFPLHNDDGHPHFWPFSDWIFQSPVSYWDPAHHGRIWSVIEVLLALVLLIILWRRFNHFGVRALLLLAGLSYAVVTGYWFLAF